MITQNFLSQFREARTRFSYQLTALTEADLSKKLENTPNSAGFLLRHIAEVELLFAKNVFGLEEVKVTAKTVIEKKDSGEWQQLIDLLSLQNYAFEMLQKAIAKQSDSDWQSTITTQEFGQKTKAEALGRIISHTAYHAGQLAMVLKYG